MSGMIVRVRLILKKTIEPEGGDTNEIKETTEIRESVDIKET